HSTPSSAPSLSVSHDGPLSAASPGAGTPFPLSSFVTSPPAGFGCEGAAPSNAPQPASGASLPSTSPSLSMSPSVSHASPSPSLTAFGTVMSLAATPGPLSISRSAFCCPELATVGQLSVASLTPSPSASGNVCVTLAPGHETPPGVQMKSSAWNSTLDDP